MITKDELKELNKLCDVQDGEAFVAAQQDQPKVSLEEMILSERAEVVRLQNEFNTLLLASSEKEIELSKANLRYVNLLEQQRKLRERERVNLPYAPGVGRWG